LGANDEVTIQCVVESDAWDQQSRRKWTGAAAGPGALLSKLVRHYNGSLPQGPPARLLLQYYDADVSAFVDLVDGDSSWSDFQLQVGAKRLRLVEGALQVK
jgi:hypothetical protein